MKFLFFLIFILSIGGSIFFLIIRYEHRISSLHIENMLLKRQLSKVQEQYKKLDTFKNNCTIKYLNIDNYYGIIPKGSLVYLCPYTNSCVLQKLSIAMEVRILEKVLVDNIIWYYISLPIESDINCRGWIGESCFSSLSSSNTDVVCK